MVSGRSTSPVIESFQTDGSTVGGIRRLFRTKKLSTGVIHEFSRDMGISSVRYSREYTIMPLLKAWGGADRPEVARKRERRIGKRGPIRAAEPSTPRELRSISRLFKSLSKFGRPAKGVMVPHRNLERCDVSNPPFYPGIHSRDLSVYEYWERESNLETEASHCLNNAFIISFLDSIDFGSPVVPRLRSVIPHLPFREIA